VKMLIVGAGVIGTVYGAHIAAAGNKVSVLSHPPMKWPREPGVRARALLSG
jgi:ketopantoate reductase